MKNQADEVIIDNSKVEQMIVTRTNLKDLSLSLPSGTVTRDNSKRKLSKIDAIEVIPIQVANKPNSEGVNILAITNEPSREIACAITKPLNVILVEESRDRIEFT